MQYRQAGAAATGSKPLICTGFGPGGSGFLEMEQLILEGRISVNNRPAHIGQRIQFGDRVGSTAKPIRYRIDPPQRV